MEPVLKEGSLLLNEIDDFDQIKVGDVITYKTQNADMYITHRVKKIDTKQKRILCKGDANKVDDTTYIDYKSQYQGTLIFNMPVMGSILSFLHGTWGRFISIVIMLFLLGAIAFDLYQKKVS